MKRKREDVFSEFRKMSRGVLVCTSVLARGIDVPGVDWVLQYDPPREPEEFVHRSNSVQLLSLAIYFVARFGMSSSFTEISISG